MTVYRIYTEDLNRTTITLALDALFDSYTILEVMGVWEATPEKAIIIEIIEPVDRWDDIINIAERIRIFNTQEAVMITRHEVDAILLEA